MSRIDRISIQTYRYTLDDFGPSIAVYQPGGKLELTRFMVTIDTDDGLSGSYAPHFGGTAHAQAQVEEMARGLIGLDPEQRERVFERLKLSHRHYDKSGIGAIDTALWDLAGKKYGVPVARLLGGFRERLPVYASTTPGQRRAGGLDSVERYADFAESCQAAGIPAFKIHGFFDGNPKTEIAIMSAVRQRVGQDMKLMTDPASSLKSFMDAVGLAEEVGVEPTRRFERLNGFEGRAPHRRRCSSAVECSIGSVAVGCRGRVTSRSARPRPRRAACPRCAG